MRKHPFVRFVVGSILVAQAETILRLMAAVGHLLETRMATKGDRFVFQLLQDTLFVALSNLLETLSPSHPQYHALQDCIVTSDDSPEKIKGLLATFDDKNDLVQIAQQAVEQYRLYQENTALDSPKELPNKPSPDQGQSVSFL